ncbi:hypothetical protein D9M68_993700 [compost metagenome]
MAEADLAGTRVTDLDFLVAKHFRSPGFIHADGFGHAQSPIWILVIGSRTR